MYLIILISTRNFLCLWQGTTHKQNVKAYYATVKKNTVNHWLNSLIYSTFSFNQLSWLTWLIDFFHLGGIVSFFSLKWWHVFSTGLGGSFLTSCGANNNPWWSLKFFNIFRINYSRTVLTWNLALLIVAVWKVPSWENDWSDWAFVVHCTGCDGRWLRGGFHCAKMAA